MIRNYYFLLLIFLLSCGSKYHYTLTTQDARGLLAGEKVVQQGVEIGEVKAVRIEGSRAVIDIKIDNPMYAGQDFSIERVGRNGRQLEIDPPVNASEPLESGATIEERGSSLDIHNLGEALENTLENVFGSETDELVKLTDSVEVWLETFSESAKTWATGMEDWAREHEEELNELKEKFEDSGEEHREELEKMGREIESITERYGIGTPGWKKAMSELLETYRH